MQRQNNARQWFSFPRRRYYLNCSKKI
jgi:hypothetical protein